MMSERAYSQILLGVVIILFVAILGLYYMLADFNPKDHQLIELQKIESKLDFLRNQKDSIRTIILTTDREILKNEKHHEEVVNTIIIQSSNADSIFARDYIKKFIDERVR